MRHLLTLSLAHDQDVVSARRRAAELAGLLGFDLIEQTRIATAVSEIARNAFRYAHGGTVAFAVAWDSRPQRFVTQVTDTGPGIPDLPRVLAGEYASTTGLGMGIAGARRLMDKVTIDTDAGGTRIVLEMDVPRRAPLVTPERLEEIARAIGTRGPATLLEEVQAQNQMMLRTLDELHRRQDELQRLNRELEDTNRGVVALYAELDDKAEYLRRADELKSRFLSNMTHEFRTPVHAIMGLCNLLLEDRQREGREPEPELRYIREAADQLLELVNDLLDLAKVEAGRTVVRPAALRVEHVFGALRGMLRPLLLNQSVSLVFEDAERLPEMYTDEAKLSQILRNLVSNALKFTERGEVRISAVADAEAATVTFSVADTGIGIAADDLQRIFDEFTQLEHRLQRGVRGSGLGLALSRRLTELLGGRIGVESEPGVGSTFRVTLPMHYAGPAE
jgi:signal transduction histidine kinase